MATKNISASKIKGDTKNVMVNDTVDAVLLSDKKSVVMEEQDSSDIEKGNKSSTSSSKILKTSATAASTPTITTIKKEITSNEEEPSSKVPANKPTRIKLVKTVNQQASEVNSNATADVAEELSDGDKKGVIRLSVKDLSDEERRKLRAKRFNIIVADTSPKVKKAVTTKASNTASKGISSSSNVPVASIDILKRRAERFGENVSTVMKSLDHKEKMLKRKLKFLEGATNLKEVEIKKQRAERFRMI